MSIKLIASDLDGTLLTDKKELSPGTRKALDMAVSEEPRIKEVWSTKGSL